MHILVYQARSKASSWIHVNRDKPLLCKLRFSPFAATFHTQKKLFVMASVQECFGKSLIEAVKENDASLVKVLIAQGAPLDAVDEVSLCFC